MNEENSLHRRRFERERLARKQAENIAEKKSREHYIKSQALEKAAQAEREARQEVETLLHALEAFTSRLDTSEIIEHLHHHIDAVAPNHGMTVCLFKGECFQIVSRRGDVPEGRSVGETIPTPDILSHIKGITHPIVIANTASDERIHTFGMHAETQSMMILPLSVQSRIIGYLSVESRQAEAFGDAKVRVAQALANESAISLENARLFQEVEKLSTTDPLTGLNNRRFLNMAAKKLLQLSSRNMRPFSALMVDIDYFKRVNDAYGHAVGDRVLVAVAQACQQSIRGADLSARYGGEEFCFILSETSSKGAHILAERLRTTIAALKFESNGQSFSVTVSIGISECVEDDKVSLKSLLERSDEALYEAKRAGRNCVVIWTSKNRSADH